MFIVLCSSRRGRRNSNKMCHNYTNKEGSHACPGGCAALALQHVSWASEPLSLTPDRGLLVDVVWLLHRVPSQCFIQKLPTGSKQLSSLCKLHTSPSYIVKPCTAVVSLSLEATNEGLIFSVAPLCTTRKASLCFCEHQYPDKSPWSVIEVGLLEVF